MRLRPLTDDRPKGLIEVNGRPLSEHQLDWMARSGVVDGVVFACGYKWEKLRERFGADYKGISISYSVEEEPLGTGGAIRKAMVGGPPEDRFIAANGDIVTDLPLKEMVAAHLQGRGAAASMLVVPYRSRFGVVKIDSSKVVRGFDEKPAFPDVWINGGVYVLEREATEYLPDRGDIERETFPRMAQSGKLLSYPYQGDWWFVDSVKDLKEVESSMRPQA